jgi:hypothetical protein
MPPRHIKNPAEERGRKARRARCEVRQSGDAFVITMKERLEMRGPLRLTTLRIGTLSFNLDGHDFVLEVRLLEDSEHRYRVLSGELSEPFASLEEAVARAEAPEPRPPDLAYEVRWRESLSPLPAEHACPTCGSPVWGGPRYPHKLCPACVLEATDPRGRSLRFANLDLCGGLEARYTDDGSLYEGQECLVRGVRCRADEHRFGGIVLQPL